MTIASAIQTKQQQVVDSYTAVSNKGGTLPATQNLTNLATAISTIPSGGSSPVITSLNVTPTTSAQTITAPSGTDGYSPVNVAAVTAAIDQNITAGNIKKDVTILGVTGSLESGGGSVDHGGEYSVKVIDYDGSIIAEDHLNTGDVFTLPSPPNKNPSLVFQEWSGTTTITNNTVTVGTEDILIGAIYETASGLCEFDIELDENTGLEIYARNIFDTGTLQNTAQVDWGDGIVETKPDSWVHTYSKYGKYTIKTNLRFDGSHYAAPFIQPNDSSVKYGSTGIMKAMRLSSNATTSGNINNNFNFWRGFIEYVTIPRGVTNCLIEITDCINLKSIILPTTLQSVERVNITTNRALKYLIVPNDVYNSITKFSLYKTFDFKNFKIPNSITELPTSGDNYKYNYNLEKLIIPSSITTIPQQIFRYNYRLKYVYVLGNITSIDRYAFYESDNLRIIDFTHCSSVPTLSNTNALPLGIKYTYTLDSKILVPKSLESSWKSATNWSTFANIIYGV